MEGTLTALTAVAYGIYAIASISSKDGGYRKYLVHGAMYSALALIYFSKAFDLHFIALALFVKFFW